MKKYRIRRRDKRNWCIEKWQQGGQEISRGKYAGNETKEGWDEVNPEGYYPHIKGAARDLLNTLVGEEWPTDGWTGQDVQDAFDRAEARVLETVERIDATVPQIAADSIANPAAEFSAAEAQSVRDARDPVLVYLQVTGGRRFKRTSDETLRGLKPKEAALERVNALASEDTEEDE